VSFKNSLKLKKNTNARPGIVSRLFFKRNQTETAKKQQVLLYFVNTIWQLSSAALATKARSRQNQIW
jgi:hypothetical protein